MRDIEIVSVTYSIRVTPDIIKQILNADWESHKKNTANHPKGVLRHKLEKRKEVKKVSYVLLNKKLKGGLEDKIYITIFTNSVSNPDKNQKYWQGIATEIETHIKKE